MLKKISFAVLASIVGYSAAYAQDSNAVINKVADTYANKGDGTSAQTPQDLESAFAQLKAEWRAQQAADQKRLDASLAENKRLAEKLKSLEVRFNQMSAESTEMASNSGSSSVSSDNADADDSSYDSHLTVKHVKAKTGDEHKNAQVNDARPTTLRNQGGAIAYIGDDSDFGQMTVFEAYPSSQVPLFVLKGRNNFGDRALVFGGYIEADGSVFWGGDFNATENAGGNSTGTYNNGYNLNLTTATLDVMANINEYIQTFWSITSNDLGTPYIQNAFVTFGNLKENPFFFSVGKSRIPMGVWAGGGPWISGITQGYFRPTFFTNAMVSYYNDGLSLNLAGFVPETSSTKAFTNEGDFMVSLFYGDHIPGTDMTYGFNAAYLYNYANTGMGSANCDLNGPVDTYCQSNSGQKPSSTGSVELTSSNISNGVLNIEGNIGLDDVAVFAGWSGFTGTNEQTMGNYAGAWYIQPTYSPVLFDQVTVFGVSWGQAYNMNNFFFPTAGQASFGISVQGVQREFVAFIQRPIMTPQVLLGIEYGWLGMYNGAQTSEVTVDLSVYF
ncbi:DUF3573 domain-containing protein [Francisellaceae bacterium]|nr:DUF3573 domain-containing protein [Francisellaceae bacterium]